MPEFVHLHVHSQYSILDGAASFSNLLKKTKELGMESIAITDHGNMYGILEFQQLAKGSGIKPIIGCEIYVSPTNRFDKRGREDRSGHHLILLAKNLQGYFNLSKLCSLGFKEGFYYTARIDKELLQQYKEGLIASSACLGGELAETILSGGLEKAEAVVRQYQGWFGDDYYLEMMDHGWPNQKKVNEALVTLSKRTGAKLIATNDVHFVNAADYEAHKILICLNTGKELDEAGSLHYTGNEYLKSPDEMVALFADYPEAIENTVEISKKIENFIITTDHPLLPQFPVPSDFSDEMEYLTYLTYNGAKKYYPDFTNEVKERIEFELEVIKKTGYAGYFLIVYDFIKKAREMGVLVGPGRGSAAGSIVSYLLEITRIDPLRYRLLFERFLNPERITMPDIDVDFDDEGRDKVLKYVIDKYGESRVAQIITFGTMAARSAIRDVARVLKLPLPDADRLAKMVPEKPGITLQKAIQSVTELQEVLKGDNEKMKKTLIYAQTLEGSNRHTGKHACGVIIGPDDLINYVPLGVAKDSELMVTQYEGNLIEKIGLLKMDFLGLKTLSIIKEALINIKRFDGTEIDTDNLPLDDHLTFELYRKGDTIGTFQFESDGMRNVLRELQPTNIEDLIATNALFRPGPMDFIPTYIKRKHGREEVTFPLPVLSSILDYTYGIMVYQEQIMQTTQVVAGFTPGHADEFRKVMGKKEKEKIPPLREAFIKGAIRNGYSEEDSNKLFDIMQSFAQYGFNRSHSAAYSIIAYQTAYLKAHYPAQYMAAVLTHNLGEIKKITSLIDECRRMGIPVLGPDINESELSFRVNTKGEIRFGLAAVKGVGESAVNEIITEREQNGPFTDIFDLTRRVNLRSVNKRTLESLAYAGAFDGFGNMHRAQYFFREDNDESNFLDKIIRYANAVQTRANSVQHSLFGGDDNTLISAIEIPACNHWTKMEQLRYEREVTGFYMSGHPLDDYRLEFDILCNINLTEIKDDPIKILNRPLIFAGLITSVANKIGKNNKPYTSFTIEDFNDQYPLLLFSEESLKYRHLLIEGTAVIVNGQMQQRYGQEDRYEMKVANISLLAEALDKMIHNINLTIPLQEVDDKLIRKLLSKIKKNRGDCTLSLRVADADDKISVSLIATKHRVECSSLLKDLRDMPNIGFKLS